MSTTAQIPEHTPPAPWDDGGHRRTARSLFDDAADYAREVAQLALTTAVAAAQELIDATLAEPVQITHVDGLQDALALLQDKASAATDGELSASAVAAATALSSAVATLTNALSGKQDAATAATDTELAAAVSTLNTSLASKQDGSLAATDVELANAVASINSAVAVKAAAADLTAEIVARTASFAAIAEGLPSAATVRRLGASWGMARPASGSFVVGPALGGGQDDTPQIQAACDAARAVCGEVVLMQGQVYLIDGLRVHGADQKAIRLRCEGARGYQLTGSLQYSTLLRRLPNATASAGIIATGHGLELDGIIMDGNNVAGQGVMLDVKRGFELSMERCRIVNAPSGAAAWRALSNNHFDDVRIENCATDGLMAGLPGAAPAVLLTGNHHGDAEGDWEYVSNTVKIAGLHLERNLGCDIMLAVGSAVDAQAEFVEFDRLHIESPIPSADPCIWLGNARCVTFNDPFIVHASAEGALRVERNHNVGNTPMMTCRIFGGTLMGAQTTEPVTNYKVPYASTPQRHVHLVAGDKFWMFATNMDCSMAQGVLIEPTYGPSVWIHVDPMVQRSSTDGAYVSSTTRVTDNRPAANRPAFAPNLSIGGGGIDTMGGSVQTRTAAGLVRNTLDDGSGNAIFTGATAMLGGIQWGFAATFTTNTTLSGVVGPQRYTGSANVTLTLQQSSNLFLPVKNDGTGVLTIAKSGGTAPNIDGLDFIRLLPGESVMLMPSQSSGFGTWVVLAKSTTPGRLPAPTLTALAALGTAPATAPALRTGALGNQLTGIVEMVTGTSPVAGPLVTVTFGLGLGETPRLIGLYAQNSGAALVGLYPDSVGPGGFRICAANAPAAGTAYQVGFQVSR